MHTQVQHGKITLIYEENKSPSKLFRLYYQYSYNFSRGQSFIQLILSSLNLEQRNNNNFVLLTSMRGGLLLSWLLNLIRSSNTFLNTKLVKNIIRVKIFELKKKNSDSTLPLSEAGCASPSIKKEERIPSWIWLSGNCLLH